MIPPDVGELPKEMTDKTTPLPDGVTPVQDTSPKPEDIKVKTPYEEYLEALTELKMTADEAANIVDALITKGYAEETFVINKKFQVRFRTRSQDVTNRIDKALADSKPEFNASYANVVAVHNVSASLVRYNTFEMKPYESDIEFEKSLKFIQKLPQPVFQILVSALTRFDQKMMVATNSSAVIANF